MLTLLKSRAALDLRRLDRYDLTWTGKGYPRFAIEFDRLSGLCQAQGNVKKKLFRCRQRFGHRETIEIRKNLLESWRSVIIKLLQRPHVTALAQPIPVFLVFQASPIPNIGLEIDRKSVVSGKRVSVRVDIGG